MVIAPLSRVPPTSAAISLRDRVSVPPVIPAVRVKGWASAPPRFDGPAPPPPAARPSASIKAPRSGPWALSFPVTVGPGAPAVTMPE